MGDAADDALDREIFEFCDELDNTDDPDIDPYGLFFRANSVQTKTCRYCGKRGLVWGKHNGNWRLFSGTELHICSPTK